MNDQAAVSIGQPVAGHYRLVDRDSGESTAWQSFVGQITVPSSTRNYDIEYRTDGVVMEPGQLDVTLKILDADKPPDS